MALRVFNSLTRHKEDFHPLKPGKVGVYVCGVTVYDLCHVGHARVYVVFDTIVRFLRRDHQVTYVRNFTDVDDKIIKRAHEKNEDPIALASHFADEFHRDMDALGVKLADVEPRVSTHMEEIIHFIRELEDKGFAYRVATSSAVEGAGSDVYFRVKNMPAQRYLQLSGRSLDDMGDGAHRVAVDDRKEDPLDFALWKSAKPGEVSWESPFGKGRPGWHIECSAMAKKHLGVTFDLHGGGKDLVFPHHTNEIAQSECNHGEVMARYWLHNGFVNVVADEHATGDDVEEIVDEAGNKIKLKKMSKSEGNFFTIRDILKQFTPEALRFLLLSTHYRGPIAFSHRLVEEAEKRTQYLYETLQRTNQYLTKTPAEDALTLEFAFSKPGVPFTPWKDFLEAFDDDFNTPRAVAALIEVLKVANALVAGREKEFTAKGEKLKPGLRARLLTECRSLFVDMGAILGLGQREAAAFLDEQRALRLHVKGIARDTIDALLAQRAEAKKAKDFTKADAVRADLIALGVEVRDTPDGVEWSIV